MTTTTDAPVIEQRDLKAATAWMRGRGPNWGDYDLAQAFARHRIEALSTPAEDIATWEDRCETHPEHEGIVTFTMIQDRMQEEIDDLRTALSSQAAEDAAVVALRKALVKIRDLPPGEHCCNQAALIAASSLAVRMARDAGERS